MLSKTFNSALKRANPVVVAAKFSWSNGNIPDTLLSPPARFPGIESPAATKHSTNFIAFIQLLWLIGAILLSGISAVAQNLDQFGGYTDLPVPGGATGYFRLGKIGNHWVLATPSGNAYWMRAMYATNVDDHVDDRGSTYRTRVIAKYGDADLTWGPQQNRRLLSWGFNAHSEYASAYVLPWARSNDAKWSTSTQPVKIPAVPFPLQASSYSLRNVLGFASQPVKQLYYPLARNTKYLAYGGYVGHFADVYDPNFAQWIGGRLASTEFASYAASPYLLGFSSDDGDYTTGLGAGMDFVPSQGNYHPHLGYIVAITAPTQTSATIEGQSITYKDTTVYSKLAWRDFLIARYGTIGALNSTWETSGFYTSFNSTGAWGTGTGLLDEDGRHTWMGTDPFGLTGAAAAVRADLDDFLYQIANQYFSIYRTQIQANYPHALFFGPTTVGAWNAPARRQVLRAAGQSLDLMRISWNGSQAQLDFTAQHAGDLPLAIWLGAVANPDSALWRYPQGFQADFFTTQSGRAGFYTSTLSSMLAMTAVTSGVKPFVGLQWWQYTDNWAEKSNWGIVTLSDNAYDGKEATVAAGTDAWGYRTGGEESNYGDFLSAVIQAHKVIPLALGSTGGTTTPPSLSTTVAFSSPTPGTTVQQSVTVAATATGSVAKIGVALDGTTVSVTLGSSASFFWDTTTVPNGNHSWQAAAYDVANNLLATSSITTTVNNPSPPISSDTTPPGVSLSVTVSGKFVTVNANASDSQSGVANVQLYLDGKLSTTDTATPWNFKLNMQPWKSGSHQLQVKAYDGAGNSSWSNIVTVTK
jgi:hypothetical protein